MLFVPLSVTFPALYFTPTKDTYLLYFTPTKDTYLLNKPQDSVDTCHTIGAHLI